jgi:AcrR family transcriptional regulator
MDSPGTSTPPATGRRARRRAVVRQALLDAALVMFGERGMQATRVEDLTEAADLGKGAFYNYFESKHALAAALLDLAVDELDAILREAVRGCRTSAERLGRVVEGHERFFDEHPLHVALFLQARSLLQLSDTGEEQLRSAFRRYLLRVAGALGSAADEAAEDDLAVAAVVAGALMGSRTFMRAAQLAPRRELVGDVLRRGLADRRSPAGGPAPRRLARRMSG